MPPKKAEESTVWTSGGLPKDVKYQLCVVQAGQTGDASHVAAAAALDDNTDILVISPEKEDETTQLMAYFKSVTHLSTKNPGRERVRFIALKPKPGGSKARDIALYNMMVDDQTNQRVDLKTLVGLAEDYLKMYEGLSRDQKAIVDLSQEERKVYQLLSHDQIKLLRWDVDKESGIYHSFGPSSASRLIAQVWRNSTKSASIDTAPTKSASIDTASTNSASTDTTSTVFEKLANRLSYDPAKLNINSIISGAEAAGMRFPPVDATNDIVLLWARYSGSLTPTSYNPEGDSDIEGQKQLAENVLSTSTSTFTSGPTAPVITIEHGNASDQGPPVTIITIGHDNASGQGVRSRDFHLGERFFKEGPVEGKGRGGQLSFFLALMARYPRRLYQIGQKTGAMDAAALVGIPTVYIEDEGSPAKGRMANWIGAVPFFRCAVIKEPPTVLGKAMRSLDREIKQLQGPPKLAVQIPTSRQKDANTPMPRDQWRRIAMLYQGLIEPFSNAKGQHSDPISITNACFAANQATLKIWDDQIKALTTKQLKTAIKANLFAGYSPKDLTILKRVFEEVRADYQKVGSIIRNKGGNYVRRDV